MIHFPFVAIRTSSTSGIWKICIILIIAYSYNLSAQNASESFGKNRIQYKNFEWKYYNSKNFDLYLYEDDRIISEEIIDFLENEFDRITGIIGHSPYAKTQIILYNSITDMRQSNVGLSDDSFYLGSPTSLTKGLVEVAHPGTITGLKEELILHISQYIVNEMMFGGNFSDTWDKSSLLNLPDWLINGVALYIAKGWTIEMDDYIRDQVNSGGIKNLNKISGNAGLVGQSIWNYIVEKYGRRNIQNILQLTRITKNAGKSIDHTLGISQKQLISEWKDFYEDMAAHTHGKYKSPSNGIWLKTNEKKGSRYRQIQISPDSKKLAFAKNLKGRYSVIVHDIERGIETTIISGGDHINDYHIDYEIPIISWANDNTLGIINVVKGIYTFWLYDINTKSKIRISLKEFEQVQSFDFNDNGRLAVLSAFHKGRNDLYLMSVRRGRFRQLTDDHFDDIDPVFIPNANTIVFSSNRSSTQISYNNSNQQSFYQNFNLYTYNLDATTNNITQITNTTSQDVTPIPLNEYEIFYLSDQKGIVNIFRYGLMDRLYKQVTNYSTSLKSFDIDFTGRNLASIIWGESKDRIILESNFNYGNNLFTPLTLRQQTKLLAERRQLKKNSQSWEISATLDFNNKTKNNSNTLDLEKKVNDTVNNAQNAVITQNTLNNNLRAGSFLSKYPYQKTKRQIIGPLNYETNFTANSPKISIVIDPLKGFGFLLETQLTDLFENHRFSGSVMSTPDLRSGDIFAEYQYLQNLVDYSGGYSREVIYWNTESTRQRYTKNEFEIGASLPLSAKIRATFKPYYMLTRFENLEPELLGTPGPPFPTSIQDPHIGFRSELIFDNTSSTGVNQIEGTRGKLEFIHHESVSDRRLSFSNISLDFRHYQKLQKEIVFATRLFYGKFIGQNPQSYVIGGMDNWLFNHTNNEEIDNPLNIDGKDENTNLMFLEYVTGLRGFDYATQYGSNTLLFNSELRVSIFRSFFHNPIPSSLLYNLQFIGFFDIGSAWSGISPFNRENTLKTVVSKDPDSPFQSIILNYSNPWLASYGVGIRTVILDYFVKFDIAWPIENYNTGHHKLLITFGYDF